MEQNQINAIIIAGIVVIGAGAWAGPMMQAETLKGFVIDLGEIQTAQIGFYDDQGWSEWDEFGIGDVKDEIFFFDHDDSFAAPTITFGGPILALEAFSQQMIPDDVTGIAVTTATAANTFGDPVTFIEMTTCDDPDADIGGTKSRILDECQPAIVDKVFIMTPNTSETTDKFRVQLAVCEDQNMLGHQNDGSADNDPAADDECDDVAGTTSTKFDDAIIILDVIVQPGIDHTQGFIVERGAIPAFKGSTLMVRAADSGNDAEALRIWVGVIRTGDEHAFNFINPVQFGGAPPTSCVLFTIRDSGDLTNNLEIELFFGGLSYFGTTSTLASAGQLLINNIPDEQFAIIDLFVDDDGDGFDEVFFLDRFFDVSEAPNVLNQAGDQTCVDVSFDTANKPQF